MTRLTKGSGFRSEKDLEDYLETRLWLTGQDLLVIGRQVKISGGEIDLLAIDSTGLLHIVELKLDKASPSVIGQILHYWQSIKQMNREELIHVAHGNLRIDLEVAFQQRFDHPLPETVNESPPALMIIGDSFHRQTASSILALRGRGWSVTTFRYVNSPDVQSGPVRLIPCCRSDQDVKDSTHSKVSPSAQPNDIVVAPDRRPFCQVHVDENVRRFWATHSKGFMPFVTFGFIYGRYIDWVHEQADDNTRVRQMGQFGKQLSAITRESNEWTSVFVGHRSDMAVYDTIMAPPSVRTSFASGHTLRAYQLNSITPVSEL